MSFLSPIKKSVNKNGTLLELALGFISLLVVLGFTAADIFWQITMQETSTKVMYSLNLINLGFFTLKVKDILKELNMRNYTEQLFAILLGACIIGATPMIAKMFDTVITFLFSANSAEIETRVTLYCCGGALLVIGVLSFIWKFTSNMWESLKNAWERA